MSHTKKRHHYIPQVYLEGFRIGTENLAVYRYEKHEGTPPKGIPPLNLALEQYYYAFDKEDERDTNTLEDMFSIVEAPYPDIVTRISNKEIYYPEDISNLATFMAMMRVRVPNFRLQYEAGRAEHIKTETMLHAKHNKDLQKHYNQLLTEALEKGDVEGINALKKAREFMERGDLVISVDPQISLEGVSFFQGIHDRLMSLNWSFFTSGCGSDFITSDNPTLWHDTRKKDFYPYRGGYANPNVQFIFPLTKNILVLANSLTQKKVSYGVLSKKWVHTFNRAQAMSAEKYIFASQEHLGKMISRYRNIVPTQENIRIKDGNGYLQIIQPSLGSPHNLPRWKPS